ncbi:MAG: hypothetical protein JXQ29_06585 [Planctomycetes bacterium]|nr:hypothetical protein [Planctomycetota bacterium]
MELRSQFHQLGHEVQATPDGQTQLILSTARFGEPLSWRHAPMFTARRRYGLERTPAVSILVHIRPGDLLSSRERLRAALDSKRMEPVDFVFPGLVSRAPKILYRQGRRGGPMMALVRLMQAQAKCLRGVLVVGDDRPEGAYVFDLVGAHPYTGVDRSGPDSGNPYDPFYEDIVLRLVTAVSTCEADRHQCIGDPVPRSVWKDLSSPAAMGFASQQLDARDFFTETVHIDDLIAVPAFSDAVARQYSEGCFATWEPELGALIATATGSARPVSKGNITENDLAVIVGTRADGRGVFTRPVEGRSDVSPSSEALEMMDMDSELPTILFVPAGGAPVRVPVARSKLHGHRGVAAYDPRRVEYVPLDPPYYHYPVSCGTEAQAWGIKSAFARSEALQDPGDSRQVVFTVLPGHGVFIVEKWAQSKEPFQRIWESMDDGSLEVEDRILQGPMRYVSGAGGRMVVRAESAR